MENVLDGEYVFEIEDIEIGDISYFFVFDLGDGEGEEDNVNCLLVLFLLIIMSSGGVFNIDFIFSEGGNIRDGGIILLFVMLVIGM